MQADEVSWAQVFEEYARWISPIGMVRVDVGFGLQKEGNPVRMHLSIGPDF